MPKLTELTAASSLANTDLLVVTTNTSGSAVSNSVNVATLAQAVQVANPLIKTIEGDSGTIISSNSSASVKIAGGSGVTTATSGNTLTITVDSSSFSTGFTVSQINTPSGNVVSDNRAAFVANIAQSNGVLVTASGNTITFTFDPSTINTLTDVTAPEYNSEGALPANNAAYNGHTVVAGGKLYHGANNVFNKHFDTRDYVAGDIPGSAVHTVTVNSGKYLIDGTRQQALRLVPGMVYWFDTSDNSNDSHPLAFSKTFDGTHNSGSEIANNTSSDGTIIYQRVGTAGQAGSYTKVQLQQDCDELYYYYCTNHSGMGGDVTTLKPSRADIKFTVSANGSGAYNFSGHGAQGTDNETLYVYKGFTYEFDNYASLSSHPFQLRVSSGGSAYSNGATDTNSTNGKVYWTVPMNAANIVYQCTSHGGMVGNIVVIT